eukprot:5188571-Alexandrium_andersonii.AAC.1
MSTSGHCPATAAMPMPTSLDRTRPGSTRGAAAYPLGTRKDLAQRILQCAPAPSRTPPSAEG